MHSAVDSALQPHPSPESTPSDAVGPRVQPQRLPSPAPVARAGLGKTPDWRRRPPDLAVRSPCVSALTAPSPRLVVAPHTIATLSRSSLAYRVSAIACCLVGVTLSGAHPALWGSRGPLAACQRFPPRPSVWSRSAPPPFRRHFPRGELFRIPFRSLGTTGSPYSVLCGQDRRSLFVSSPRIRRFCVPSSGPSAPFIKVHFRCRRFEEDDNAGRIKLSCALENSMKQLV